MAGELVWVPFCAVAAIAQVVRNSAQAGLTVRIGTLGATQVRFVYGLPFAALFLALAFAFGGERLPPLTLEALVWVVGGALCQIGATALMLVVMGKRAFGVAYAYIKTEPVIVALLGVALIGDRLPLLAWLAVGLVTAGVIAASVRPRDYRQLLGETRMILIGVASGALFGISSIAFRGAIEALPEGGYVLRSLTALVLTLTTQTALLGIWLAWRDRPAFLGSLREWRHSFGAGFAGAVSSACFFIAFSLTPAANVRTVALIELPLVALVSGRLTGRKMAGHELVGLAVIMGGVALLLYAHT